MKMKDSTWLIIGGVLLAAAFFVYISKARTNPNWNPFDFSKGVLN